MGLEELRGATREEYGTLEFNPEAGYHFHAGLGLAAKLGYTDEWQEGIPEEAIASLVGTGNSFVIEVLEPSENVVGMGSGCGMDIIIDATMVGQIWSSPTAS